VGVGDGGRTVGGNAGGGGLPVAVEVVQCEPVEEEGV